MCLSSRSCVYTCFCKCCTRLTARVVSLESTERPQTSYFQRLVALNVWKHCVVYARRTFRHCGGVGAQILPSMKRLQRCNYYVSKLYVPYVLVLVEFSIIINKDVWRLTGSTAMLPRTNHVSISHGVPDYWFILKMWIPLCEPKPSFVFRGSSSPVFSMFAQSQFQRRPAPRK